MNTRTQRGVALLTALLAAGSMLLTSPAQASHSFKDMQFGINTPLTVTYDPEAHVCRTHVRLWLKEYGLSGVTELRTKFKLKGTYDENYFGLPAWHSHGWYYSGRFPDDARNFWAYFQTRFQHAHGKYYTHHVRLVGHRPGFWRRDRASNYQFPGTYGCQAGLTAVSG